MVPEFPAVAVLVVQHELDAVVALSRRGDVLRPYPDHEAERFAAELAEVDLRFGAVHAALIGAVGRNGDGQEGPAVLCGFSAVLAETPFRLRQTAEFGDRRRQRVFRRHGQCEHSRRGAGRKLECPGEKPFEPHDMTSFVPRKVATLRPRASGLLGLLPKSFGYFSGAPLCGVPCGSAVLTPPRKALLIFFRKVATLPPSPRLRRTSRTCHPQRLCGG